MLLQRKKVEEITLLEEVQQNSIRENKVIKKLKKEDRQTWKDNRIVYINGRIYIPNNRKI